MYIVVAHLTNARDGNLGKTGYDEIKLMGTLPFVPQVGMTIDVIDENRKSADFKVTDVAWTIELKNGLPLGYFDLSCDESESLMPSEFLMETFRKVGWTVEIEFPTTSEA